MQCVLRGERHHGLSDGLRGLLDAVFGAVFMVADETSLLEGAARLQPTLVVVDLSLAKGDLPSLVEGVRRHAPSAKVLLLSAHDDSSVAADAMAAGAHGLVLKREIGTELLVAVDALLAGGRYLSPAVASDARHVSIS